MALVEVDRVTREYAKGQHAIVPLREASLSLERGDFVSLMGASGSGKSTLLNLVAGIDRPTRGRVVIDGVDIAGLSRSKLARWRAAHIGYVFQMHNLIPVLTAFENIEMPLLLSSMSAVDRCARVRVALEAVGLSERAEHYPRQLSGGEEQRVGIARAIVANPTLVVADEPTGDLDAESSEQVLDLLDRLNGELGMTLLVVTHDQKVAGRARRCFHLDKGQLLAFPAGQRC